MASAKIKFKSKPNADGTISVLLQIIHNRVAHPKTLCRVEPQYLDRKNMRIKRGHEYNLLLNQKIDEALAGAREYLLQCDVKGIPVNPKAFLHADKIDNDLVSHLQARIIAFDEERTRIKYRTCIRRITDAGLNRSLFNIDEAWIERFDAVLREKKNNANTRQKYISAIGSVFKEAKRKGLITVNPFEGRAKISSPGKKAKLSMDEFRKIQDLRIDNPDLEAIRKIFVFAVLSRGMRSFDVLALTKDCITGDRLRYRAQKATHGKEGKTFDILITDAMRACLDEVQGEYLFPFVTMPKSNYLKDKTVYKKQVASCLTTVNSKLKIVAALCGISKNLSMHVARHTYGFLADQSGIPLGDIQNLLGHNDITTTRTYVESIRSIDDMDDVAGRVFG